MIKITSAEMKLSELVPEKLSRKYNMFPMEIDNNCLVMGIEKENIDAIQDLKIVTGKNIILKQLPLEKVLEGIEIFYGSNIDKNDDYAKNLFEDILKKSLKQQASDVHIEPFNDFFKVRIRVDGQMKELLNLDLNIYPYLISLIKYKSNMNITEKRLPQDGRIDIKIENLAVDIRVSTVPTTYGEKIVLRLLRRDNFFKTKSELGFSVNAISKIEEIINKKTGILLVTGPTGSGKTTTVYSILKDLQNSSKNIMTIENPVEYKIKGINQIQVNSKIGLTFENGLRAILRQDPDIIMVGEIRDVETAKIAVRAAITGHLVISTLHTNDAISSIARLMDMEIEPYLLNASIIGIISQRLVRKVCPNCSNEITIKHNERESITTALSIGCDECGYTGYKGRTAVYEILQIDDDIRDAIKRHKDLKEIKQIAIKNGMITFEDSYFRVIDNKITTLEECIINKQTLS